jgi:hypothetical protein
MPQSHLSQAVEGQAKSQPVADLTVSCNRKSKESVGDIKANWQNAFDAVWEVSGRRHGFQHGMECKI